MPTQIQNEPLELRPDSVAPTARATAERLRVLHVLPRFGMGGTEHGVLKVMQGLGDDEFEHRICAVRGVDTAFASRMGVADKVYSAGTPEPGFQFPMFRMAKIMREFRPHIVHTRNFGALEGIPAARLARVPIAIHSEHGYELEIISGLPMRRRLLYRGIYSMADAVFTVTGNLREYHARQAWFSAKKMRVIHNGVNTDNFSPRLDEKERARRGLQISPDRIVLGSVGRLVPIKDHLTLLRAAELLLQAGKNVQVLLVGSGPERAKLEAYVASSRPLAERVSFAGASDQVAQLLNAMDVFVLPSVCEGMSNTLLEAMACGLPVVATRTGGNGELAEDGRSGRLFEPRDVQTLSQILAQLVNDREMCAQLGHAARFRALQEFSLAGMMERYRGLYLDLALQKGLRKRN